MTQARATQGQWSDVDGTQDTNVYARYLDTIRELDAAGAYKARSIAMLRLGPSAVALDAGCGTGEDAMGMARRVTPGGRVWGIDASASMVDESIRRSADTTEPVSFRVGSVDATGFDDSTFDAVRSDRVFQHLADPAGALTELLRVLKPGGRIAISDPDWGTYVVDGPDTDTMKTYLSFAQRQAKNPWIGRRLYPLFQAAGLKEIEVAADTLFFFDCAVIERLGNLDAGFTAAVAASALTEREVQSIRNDLRTRQAEGRFFACVTVFTVCGRKAPR